jgi:hypothetical protein
MKNMKTIIAIMIVMAATTASAGCIRDLKTDTIIWCGDGK